MLAGSPVTEEAMRRKSKGYSVEVVGQESPLSSMPPVLFHQNPTQSPAPETPILATEHGKRRRRDQQVPAPPAPPQNPTLEVPPPAAAAALTARSTKERKKRNQMSSSSSPPTAAGIPLLEQEANATKKRKRRKEHAQPLLLFDPCQTQRTTAPPEQKQEQAKGSNNSMKMRVAKLSKKQKLLQGFVLALPAASHPKCTEQNPNNSSTLAAFFDQFAYQPSRQARNPPLARTPDHLPRLPPRGFSSFESTQPTANETSNNASTFIASKIKQKDSGSGSASCSQEKRQVNEEAMTDRNNMQNKRRTHENQMSSSPFPSTSAETPIFEQEVKMTKRQMQRKDKELSAQLPLPFDPCRTHCVQLEGTTIPLELKQEKADVPKCDSIKKNNGKKPHVLSNRELIKMRVAELRKQQTLRDGFVAAMSVASSKKSTEQNPDHSPPLSLEVEHSSLVPAPPQNPTLEVPAAAAAMMGRSTKEHKKRNQMSLSSSPPAAAGTPLLEQEANVTKKRKRRKEQAQPPLPFDPCQTQRTTAPPEQKQEQAKGSNDSTKMRVAKLSKKQKLLQGFVLALPAASHPKCTEKNPNNSSTLAAFFDQFAYQPSRQARNPPLARTPDHLPRLPPRGFSSFESTQPTANETSNNASTFIASKIKQKDSGSGSASCSQEKRQVDEEAVTDRNNKQSKRRTHGNQMSSSPFPSTSAETPIFEQEAKMTKRQMRRKDKELSAQLPLPFDPCRTHCVQLEGTTVPLELKQEKADVPKCDSFKKNNGKKPHVLSNRELIKMRVAELRKQQTLRDGFVAPMSVASSKKSTEQNPDHSPPLFLVVEHSSLPPAPPQNPTLEVPAAAAAAAMTGRSTKERMKRNQMSSSSSPPAAAGTPLLEQEASATKKRKRWKEHAQPPLPFDPCQTHLTTAPPEQKQEQAKGSNDSTKMRVAKLRKKQKLPQGFVPALPAASHPKCTEQNPNHSSTLAAFFDQFAYEPSRQAHNPPLTRTPDHLPRLPPRGFSSFESPQPTANETSKNASTFVASKTKQKDSGSGSASCSQEKRQVDDEAATDMNNKQSKRRTHENQMPSSPFSSTSEETPIFEQESKMTKRQMRRKDKELSAQLPLPFDPCQTHCVQLEGTTVPLELKQEQANVPKCDSIKKNDGKKPRVLSNRELIKMRVAELRKQRTLPDGFVAAMSVASSTNSTEQNPDHSSPLDTFFDQFAYKPSRLARNPPLPRTPDCVARLPPQGYPSFESSRLTTNEISKVSNDNTSVASKKKQKNSVSQPKVNVNKNPDKKMRTKKQREPPPLLTSAEKRSDKYRRLPLNQLVCPARSPHKLLQEKYASDPWKVIVICMLLNLTQGIQVRAKVKGFFKRYPDPQSAFNADPEKMAEYLQPLGLQHVKTLRIQKFSKEYVEKEWTYITELCGVGKYAADAYAIFCAGRATEVVPKDHKLVDYWKYVCYELPIIQGLQNVQEAGVTELSNVPPRVQELAVCC